eukprot:3636495-Rhodomonas_salina.2
MLSSATSVLLIYEAAQRVASNRAFVFAMLYFFCRLHSSPTSEKDRSALSPVKRRFSQEEEEAERKRDGHATLELQIFHMLLKLESTSSRSYLELWALSAPACGPAGYN